MRSTPNDMVARNHCHGSKLSLGNLIDRVNSYLIRDSQLFPLYLARRLDLLNELVSENGGDSVGSRPNVIL
jgi:hypothetical protein